MQASFKSGVSGTGDRKGFGSLGFKGYNGFIGIQGPVASKTGAGSGLGVVCTAFRRTQQKDITTLSDVKMAVFLRLILTTIQT